MRLRVGGKTEEHLQTLGLTFPFTSSELLFHYREWVFKTHPDHGGTADAFRKVKEAFDWLKNLASSDLEVASLEESVEFGKGLGPRVNGKRCSFCEGRGYLLNEEKKSVREPCVLCLGRLWNGRGRGWCICGGTGVRWHEVSTGKAVKVVCHMCKGPGEVRIYNPVLRKATLAGKR